MNYEPVDSGRCLTANRVDQIEEHLEENRDLHVAHVEHLIYLNDKIERLERKFNVLVAGMERLNRERLPMHVQQLLFNMWSAIFMIDHEEINPPCMSYAGADYDEDEYEEF